MVFIQSQSFIIIYLERYYEIALPSEMIDNGFPFQVLGILIYPLGNYFLISNSYLLGNENGIGVELEKKTFDLSHFIKTTLKQQKPKSFQKGPSLKKKIINFDSIQK